jgi:hypothetical protein
MNREDSEYDDVAVIRQYFEAVTNCDTFDDTPLPSPELIWWRAQLAEKRRLARRSVVAIESVHAAAVIVSLVVAIFATFLWAPRLFASLPLPLPLTVASLALFLSSTGGVLLVWSRQR